jgi:hypothetical protein
LVAEWQMSNHDSSDSHSNSQQETATATATVFLLTPATPATSATYCHSFATLIATKKEI